MHDIGSIWYIKTQEARNNKYFHNKKIMGQKKERNTTKNNIFIFSCVSFLLAIATHNIYQLYYFSFIPLIIIIICFLCIYIYTKKHIIILIYVFFSFLLGIYISDTYQKKIELKAWSIKTSINKTSQIQFKIIHTHSKKDFSSQYKAKVLKIWNQTLNTNLYILVDIPVNFKILPWESFQWNFKLNEIEDFNGFSYKKYMISKNIFATGYLNSIEKIWESDSNILQKNIYHIREFLLNNINSLYPKNEAIFLWWILIGARENLPQDLKMNFNNSWLTHFIAVSGFNITILIIFFSISLKYFPSWIRVVLITWCIILFTMLVGESAPVIRASIMWILWYWILQSGRQSHTLSIILLTAIIMVLYSPISLNYDISFHLSFLAVLGIIYTQVFFEKIFFWVPNFLEMRTALVLTLAALSFSLPIMIFNFWQVSIMAPIANIAVTWTIPLAMLWWFISIIVYYVFPMGATIIGYFTWMLLKWDMIIVKYFWELEWSILKTDFWIYKNYYEIIYFIILIFIILYFRSQEKKESA